MHDKNLNLFQNQGSVETRGLGHRIPDPASDRSLGDRTTINLQR